MLDNQDNRPLGGSAIDLGRVTFPHLVVSVNEGWDSSISLDEDQRLPPPAQTPPTISTISIISATARLRGWVSPTILHINCKSLHRLSAKLKGYAAWVVRLSDARLKELSVRHPYLRTTSHRGGNR
ncbi:hypothetical protein ACJ73_10118, partial [Blastomyces percursus]